MTEATAGTSVRFGRATLAAIHGDLIEQSVDAIVLAANQRGIMGAGAAGAVRTAGGAEIEREAMERAPLPLGGAIATAPGKLGARGVASIVHAVVAERLAEPSTVELVRRATAAVLQLVDERRLRSLAMPAIGGGKGPGQLPAALAAEAIVDETIAHLRRAQTRLDRVLFVSRDQDDVAAFAEAIALGRERLWGRTQ
jgi:O-acetyl-ADP-ribose deacetylase (regulator of RNase III)